MFRRNFITAMVAALFPCFFQSSQTDAGQDNLADIEERGRKARPRFFRRAPWHPSGKEQAWPEVKPEDIKKGDTIIAIGVGDEGLWMLTGTTVREFFLDNDAMWVSYEVAGTTLDLRQQTALKSIKDNS